MNYGIKIVNIKRMNKTNLTDLKIKIDHHIAIVQQDRYVLHMLSCEQRNINWGFRNRSWNQILTEFDLKEK